MFIEPGSRDRRPCGGVEVSDAGAALSRLKAQGVGSL